MANNVIEYTVKKAKTSKTIYVQIDDLSDNNGLGKTGLAFNTGSLTAYYTRAGAAAVAITLATQTVTGAWATGGFVEVDATNAKGLYRLDLPDAVLATGVDEVMVSIQGAADMSPVTIHINLVAYDPEAVDLGATATIADGVWDELTAGHVAAATFGLALGTTLAPPTAAAIAAAVQALLVPIAGTAQAGGASTIQLETGESAIDSAYVNYVALIVGGTGAGQARIIQSYVGATRTATVTGSWATNPDSTSKYLLLRV